MRKVMAAILLALGLLASLVQTSTPPAGASHGTWVVDRVWPSNTTSWIFNGPYFQHHVQIFHEISGPHSGAYDGRFQVISHMWGYNGQYMGLGAQMIMEDSTCPTVEQDATSWMVAYRANWTHYGSYWNSEPCGTPGNNNAYHALSSGFPNEIDVLDYFYEYQCGGWGCTLEQVNGYVSYHGTHAPLVRGYWNDVHQRFL